MRSEWSSETVKEAFVDLADKGQPGDGDFLHLLKDGRETHLLMKALRDLLDGNDSRLAFTALTWIYELNPALGLSLTKEDALREPLQDAVEAATLPDAPEAHRLALLSLSNAMSNHAAARSQLTQLAVEDWLYSILSSRGEAVLLQTLAAAAWTKLKTSQPDSTEFSAAYDIFIRAVLHREVDRQEYLRFLHPSLEGLAILTLTKRTRIILAKEDAALSRLLQLPEFFKQDSPSMSLFQVNFCLATTLYNLTMRKPINPQEKERLKSIIDRSQGNKEEWETAEEIDDRVKLLLSKDVGTSLALLSRNPSLAIRRLTGGILHNLACVQSSRGAMLQQGAVKILLNLRRQENSSSGQPSEEILPAYQACAKLLITTNPLLVLGPSVSSHLLLEAIELLSELLLHTEASSLQQFEAIMALTNMASIPGRSTDIAKRSKVLDKVETLMLEGSEENKGQMLCRRAAIQLFNNLILCEDGFMHFSQDLLGLDSGLMDDGASNLLPAHFYRTRLHILLALLDVDDLPTCQSAATCIAILSVSPRVVAFYLSDGIRARCLAILAKSISRSDTILQERTIMIMGNICSKHGQLSTPARKEIKEIWSPILSDILITSSSDDKEAIQSISKQLQAF